MIIAVANQKGGVGKSTTAAALMSGLKEKGFSVLGVDLDAQGNLTYTTGAGKGKKTALSLLTGEATAAEVIEQTESGDMIAASKELAGADAFITSTGKEYRIKEALEPVREKYDFIIIDSPPALGILTVNALSACDYVVVPAQSDIYSLQGVSQLYETILPVKKYCNPKLKIAGILLTRHNSRSVLSRDVAEMLQQLADKVGTSLFKATIREAVVVKEAQICQTPLFTYAPKAKVTLDYQQFIEELLETIGG